MATLEMFENLPRLDDDGDLAVEKNHIVPRDNEPDLRFRGTLIASVAPASAEVTGERWNELRIYKTAAGNYVLSKIGRSLVEGERDKSQVHIVVLQPQPNVIMTGGRAEIEWRMAAHSFFGFSDLAKRLYKRAHADPYVDLA